jgi:hypothetical protein
LSYYLEYYAKTTAAPKDCVMISINENDLEIEILGTGGKKIVKIPIDPPLKQAFILYMLSNSTNMNSERGKRRDSD